MIDPTSFGTAVLVLGVLATMIIAFGTAALCDMVLRRREDRAAQENTTSHDDAREGGATRAEAPARTRELVAHAPAGNAAANGSSPA